MGLMVMDPLVVPLVYAENPIEVDRNAPQHRQAQVGQAANGITLVNIAGPTAGGVSRNDYTNFNVPQNGVILNKFISNGKYEPSWVCARVMLI